MVGYVCVYYSDSNAPFSQLLLLAGPWKKTEFQESFLRNIQQQWVLIRGSKP